LVDDHNLSGVRIIVCFTVVEGAEAGRNPIVKFSDSIENVRGTQESGCFLGAVKLGALEGWEGLKSHDCSLLHSIETVSTFRVLQSSLKSL